MVTAARRLRHDAQAKKARRCEMDKKKKKQAKKAYGLFKRFVIWLAWQMLRPNCKACAMYEYCPYAGLMNEDEKGA